MGQLTLIVFMMEQHIYNGAVNIVEIVFMMEQQIFSMTSVKGTCLKKVLGDLRPILHMTVY